MFLRRYHRTKDGKTHTYYAMVESLRTEAGPRQHVVAYLGELNHDQERRWQRTVVFHNRQGEDRQLRLFPDADPVSFKFEADRLVRLILAKKMYEEHELATDMSVFHEVCDAAYDMRAALPS